MEENILRAHLRAHCQPDDLEEEVGRALAWSEQAGHELIPFAADNYPYLLRQIPRPPPLLYATGNVGLLGSACCAIVGSRSASQYGERHARWFAHDLGQQGFTIVSGLARGIDGSAHSGALQAKGQTIAVLGAGIDRIYPRCHRKIADQIASNGLLLSEFPLGAPPRAEHFPQRNRIIAGLSLGTLVIEGGLRSGSLITAGQALEQGRDVFALPGPVDNRNSHGCHKLLREGATLVESPEELAALLLQHWHHGSNGKQPSLCASSTSSDLTKAGLSQSEKKVLAALTEPGVLLDQLINNTGLAIATVNACLIRLERKGLVSQEGGRVAKMKNF